jgi:hypothetical protein
VKREQLDSICAVAAESTWNGKEISFVLEKLAECVGRQRNNGMLSGYPDVRANMLVPCEGDEGIHADVLGESNFAR